MLVHSVGSVGSVEGILIPDMLEQCVLAAGVGWMADVEGGFLLCCIHHGGVRRLLRWTRFLRRRLMRVLGTVLYYAAFAMEVGGGLWMDDDGRGMVGGIAGCFACEGFGRGAGGGLRFVCERVVYLCDVKDLSMCG